jgi:hypothetical protein
MDVERAAGEVTIRGAKSTKTCAVEEKSLLTKLNAKEGDGVLVRIRNRISGEVQR